MMTMMITIMDTITMNTPMDSAALYRLMTWMSPSYPVGAFSYSHGLEWDVETGRVRDAESLTLWLRDIIEYGGARNDAILLAKAYEVAQCGEDFMLGEINDYALAFAGTAERRVETAHQGNAFCDVTCRTWQSPTLERLVVVSSGPVAYPVAVAVAAVDHKIALSPLLNAYVHAFVANLISAGVRLVPLGHSDGQRVTMAVEPHVARAADQAIGSNLSQMMSTTIMADMASMKHETQYTRLFRS